MGKRATEAAAVRKRNLVEIGRPLGERAVSECHGRATIRGKCVDVEGTFNPIHPPVDACHRVENLLLTRKASVPRPCHLEAVEGIVDEAGLLVQEFGLIGAWGPGVEGGVLFGQVQVAASEGE